MLRLDSTDAASSLCECLYQRLFAVNNSTMGPFLLKWISDRWCRYPIRQCCGAELLFCRNRPKPDFFWPEPVFFGWSPARDKSFGAKNETFFPRVGARGNLKNPEPAKNEVVQCTYSPPPICFNIHYLYSIAWQKCIHFFITLCINFLPPPS